jgi:hypothetical protein
MRCKLLRRQATGTYIAERISALDIPESAPGCSGRRHSRHIFFEKVVADSGPKSEMVAEWIASSVSAEMS